MVLSAKESFIKDTFFSSLIQISSRTSFFIIIKFFIQKKKRSIKGISFFSLKSFSLPKENAFEPFFQPWFSHLRHLTRCSFIDENSLSSALMSKKRTQGAHLALWNSRRKNEAAWTWNFDSLSFSPSIRFFCMLCVYVCNMIPNERHEAKFYSSHAFDVKILSTSPANKHNFSLRLNGKFPLEIQIKLNFITYSWFLNECENEEKVL